MIIGIDPGQSGAIAFFRDSGMEVFPFSKYTPLDSVGLIEERLGIDARTVCYIERVASRPKQGVASSFKFGKHFGMYLGIMTALRIPLNYVTPSVWQRDLQCLSKGDKNVTKRRAQELFPAHKITHAVADAMLIAEYGRRQENKYKGITANDL